MKEFQIITDSTCDFPNELYEQLNLTVVPLTVLYQGQERDDTNDDSLHDLYQGLRAGESASTENVMTMVYKGGVLEFLKSRRHILCDFRRCNFKINLLSVVKGERRSYTAILHVPARHTARSFKV